MKETDVKHVLNVPRRTSEDVQDTKLRSRSRQSYMSTLLTCVGPSIVTDRHYPSFSATLLYDSVQIRRKILHYATEFAFKHKQRADYV